MKKPASKAKRGGARSSPRSRTDPLATLKAQGPAPIYAVDGLGLLADEFVAAVRAAIFPPGTGAGVDFNLDTFAGREASLPRVLDAAQTLPAFAPRRLVMVRQAEALLEGRGASEAALEGLLRYLSNPSPTTTLVFVADKFDGRSKVYKALRKEGFAVRFESPAERDMPRLLTARAEAMGKALESDAVLALVSGVGADLGAAVQALEQLVLYVGPENDDPIRAEDVDAVVSPVREESVFQLIDALADGDQDKVSQGLYRILVTQREPPLRLLALVARQYRNLIRAKAALEAGLPERELPSLLGVPPFAADKVRAQAKKGSLGRFARSLASVSTTDRALKGGTLDPYLAVERLALALSRDERLDPPESY